MPFVTQYKKVPIVSSREENSYVDQVRQAVPLKFVKAPLDVARRFEHRVEATIPQGLGRTKLQTNHMLEISKAKQATEEEPGEGPLSRTKLTSRFKAEGELLTVTVSRQLTYEGRPSSALRRAGRSAYGSPASAARNRSLGTKKPEPRTPISVKSRLTPVPNSILRSNQFRAASPISKGRTSRLVWSTSFETPTSKPMKSPIKTGVAESFMSEGVSDFYDGEYSKDQKEGFGKVTYSNGDEYAGNWRKNMRHGHGTYFYKATGMRYDGDWENNSKNGNGVLTFSNGDIMDSGWIYDEVSESKIGRYAYKNTDTYEGTLRKGMRHGTGLMYYNNGAKYEGGWKDDGRDGSGVLWFSDGCIFQGVFSADSTNGLGLLILRGVFPMPENPNFGDYNADSEPDYTALATYKSFLPEKTPRASGTSSLRSDSSALNRMKLNLDDVIWVTMTADEAAATIDATKALPKGKFVAGKLQGSAYCKYGVYGAYQGTFKDGMRSGYGKMTYKDTDHQISWFPETAGFYIGCWLNDERHGFGTMVWDKNVRYEGQWRQDRRHNVEGKMTFESGDVYEGSWQDNVMHGNAVFKLKDGKEYKGRFRMGMPEPCGTLIFPNGDRYEGELFEMLPNGHGKTTLLNGNYHEGHYEAGLRQGHGTMQFTDGSVFAGEWKNGLREGTGIMTYAETGETYEGDWSNDKRHGFGALYSRTQVTLFSGNWREDMREGQGKIAFKTTSLEYASG